jgi:hypothetical protein
VLPLERRVNGHDMVAERGLCAQAEGGSGGGGSAGAAEFTRLWQCLRAHVVHEATRREKLIAGQLQPHRELVDFWAFLKHGGSQVRAVAQSVEVIASQNW